MSKKSISKKDWVTDAVSNRSKAIDYNKMAKIKPYSPDTYNDWAMGGYKRYDLNGIDHPRNDVMKIKKTSYKYTGGTKATISKIHQMAKKVLMEDFTADERRQIGRVYIEGTLKSHHAVGQNAYNLFTKLNYISISPDFIDSEGVYTHELVHARQHGSGSMTRDRNTIEKMTEFETVGRVSDIKNKTTGYYSYVEGDPESNIKYDRILLTGDLRKNRKGKLFVADVEKKYNDSRIRRAHFSPAENLDRYFQIILPNKERFEVHRRYKRGVKDSNAVVLKEFTDEYGSNIIVYEWRNGKKVKLGSTIKNNLTKPKNNKARSIHKTARERSKKVIK